ncbi:hypothetical protein C3420_13825 [Acinetobacter sp. ACNIH3]|uniref:hypothetical protein n=1 Tax=unclassified Acinetobacter TaxID=196816 RepID=UPI000CDDB5E4|nr:MULTISPECIES: hypothetical protein [unclassified Acinetobacter]POU19362.1 hypothetical protein C3420_13825 [Acinetobacter sp. ACNIH3]POV71335.1 hypothetical protein C3421_16855 [Acinetobacter sp. ACNIH4]
MYSLHNLPADYQAFQTLNLCSNKVLGGGFPFSLGSELPLLVGNGPGPVIWLQAVQNSSTKELLLLVDRNVPTVKGVEVTKPEEGVIEIFIGTTKILRIKKTGSDSAIISKLDLRPIGLNITGNQENLSIGGSSFSGNTFQGAQVVIGLG